MNSASLGPIVDLIKLAKLVLQGLPSQGPDQTVEGARPQ
jgi:hypothetical protein